MIPYGTYNLPYISQIHSKFWETAQKSNYITSTALRIFFHLYANYVQDLRQNIHFII